MSSKLITVKFAGPAGLGIKTGGQLLSQILVKHGLNFCDYNEYPSLVRGGHNTYQLTFSLDQVLAPFYQVDIFFSLSPKHWQSHLAEFSKNTLIFTEEDSKTLPKTSNFLFLPIKELAAKVGNPLVQNTLCLGVLAYLLNLDKKISHDVINQYLGKNAAINITAFDLAYDYAAKKFSQFVSTKSKALTLLRSNSLICDGNEAFGWGFIKGGGTFYAAYPMTPATGVLHFLAQKQDEYKLTVVHPEDEIAAANLAAGAAFAGAKAATGTSGGGFALMNEAISFCAVAEIGMVYYLVSRPGPATGMPTWTSQGDLLHAVNSGHGEFPLVVLAPGDRQESFDFAVASLNLASQLQTPVIVLSDKFLGESGSNNKDYSKIKPKIISPEISDLKTLPFSRYFLKTKTGISPLSFPGTPNGQFLSNSYEHDESGFSTEDGQIATAMVKKRQQKLVTAKKLVPKVNFFGNSKAKKLIISWGSTKGPIIEALKLINDEKYAFLQLTCLWPINPNLQHIINGFKDITVIEANSTGQLTTLLKSQFNFLPSRQLLKSVGRPFFPEELVVKLST